MAPLSPSNSVETGAIGVGTEWSTDSSWLVKAMSVSITSVSAEVRYYREGQTKFNPKQLKVNK
jgi:hypothetical protein